MLSCIASVAALLGVAVAKPLKATFTDDKTGLAGDLIINNGAIMADLNVTTLKTTKCADATSFYYHIHTKAVAAGNGIDDACSAANTGGHIDQTHACGKASGLATNNVCDDTCISTGGYMCDMKADNAPYNCELGDLSGMFGKAMITNETGTRKLKITASSPFLLRDGDFEGTEYSVVFHCDNANKDRAFCASLTKDSTNDNGEMKLQTFAKGSLTATFTGLDNTMIKLQPNLTFSYALSLANAEIVKNETSPRCPNNAWQLALYNAKDGAKDSAVGTDACKALVDNVWDPTKQCWSNLMPGNATLCPTDGKICTYDNTYKCIRSRPATTCSPADLSGLTSINVDPLQHNTTNAATNNIINVYMPALALAEGKIAVIQCKAKTLKSKLLFAACAKLKAPSTPQEATTTKANDSSGVLLRALTFVLGLSSMLAVLF